MSAPTQQVAAGEERDHDAGEDRVRQRVAEESDAAQHDERADDAGDDGDGDDVDEAAQERRVAQRVSDDVHGAPRLPLA